MMTEKPDERNFKIGGFSPDSLYSINLIPLLDSLGWKGSNTDLIEALMEKSGEMNLEGLLKTMANLRFEGRETGRLNKKIISNKLPVLCISTDNVYTLIRSVNGGYEVYDGANACYKYLKKLPRIRNIVTFNALEGYRFTLLKQQKKWFSQVLQRFRREWAYTAVLSILITIFSFITPLIVIMIYSQIQSADSPAILLYLAVAMGIFILSVNGLKYFRRILLSDVSERMGNIISNEVFRRLLYLPPQFTEVASVQQQTNRIRDFETIKDFYSGTAMTSLIDAPLSLLLLVGLFIISGPVALVPLGAMAVFVVYALISYKSYEQISSRGNGVQNRKSQIQNEMLSQLHHIRISGHSDVWFKKFEKYSREAAVLSRSNSAYLQRINVVAKSITSISLILTICIAVLRILDGAMSGGTLFAAFLLTNRILNPVSSGFTVFSQYSRFQKSVDQLNRLMNLSIEQRPQTVIKVHKQMEGDIQFRNVFLKYNKEYAPALLNLSFTVKEGELIGIVGHGGSGKSSILKLLMGMYSPLSGSILIDNINLKQIDVMRLRKSIAYVPSKNFQFSGTILSNLYLSRPDASDNQIRECLELTGADKMIESMENGLDTIIDEIPANLGKHYFLKLLSFVQAQLRQAPLCLIDEPEEGLTGAQINNVKRILMAMSRNRTILMVSSQRELLDLTDKCLWIDNGRSLVFAKTAEVLTRYEGEFLKNSGR